MNTTVAPKGPLGREGFVKSILAEKKHTVCNRVLCPRIRYNADHPAPGLQAGILRRPICSPGIAGHPVSYTHLTLPTT